MFPWYFAKVLSYNLRTIFFQKHHKSFKVSEAIALVHIIKFCSTENRKYIQLSGCFMLKNESFFVCSFFILLVSGAFISDRLEVKCCLSFIHSVFQGNFFLLIDVGWNFFGSVLVNGKKIQSFQELRSSSAFLHMVLNKSLEETN